MDQCSQCGGPLNDGAQGSLCARCLPAAATQANFQASQSEAETVADQTLAAVVPARPGEDGPALPRQLGPIHLVRRIGKGGMGEVWLGQHTLLGREVAVKLLLGAVVDERDPAFTTFIQGARAAASVELAGLNKVYHADVAAGVPYLVLELLDGPNLSDLIQPSKPLDLSVARAVLEATAEAVAELNQHEMIHRDLKPSNVMLTQDGRVVVTDFGLACARPAAAFGGASGGVAGTPAYMAPEMFEGIVSARTDVYALGMTAYHILCGRVAFAGGLDEQRRQHRDVPLDVDPLLAAGVPNGVVEVVVRATAKDPMFRPKSAWHVLESLRAAFNAAGIQRAGREELARMLRQRTRPGDAQESAPAVEASSSYLATISEAAARKREHRAATLTEPLIPVAPPTWVAASRSEPSAQSEESIADSRRRERLRARLAFLVACVAGSTVGTGAVLLCVKFGPSWEKSIGAVVAHVFPAHPLLLDRHRSGLASFSWNVLLPLSTMTVASSAASVLTYVLLRGRRRPHVGEHTACGWCQHALSGLSQPVCPECGHRVGDRGPDEQGRRPLGLTWSWRTRALGIMLAFTFIAILGSGVLMGTLLKRAMHLELADWIMIPAMAFLGSAMAGLVYEGFAKTFEPISGRSWCTRCHGELKNLAEPVCPACGTQI